MGDSVYFVSQPILAELDGDNVRVTIRSGHREFMFETSRSNFVASWTGFTLVVRASCEPRCEVVELDVLRGGH